MDCWYLGIESKGCFDMNDYWKDSNGCILESEWRHHCQWQKAFKKRSGEFKTKMVRAYQIFHQPFAALVAQDYMALSTLFSYTIRSHWQKTKIEDQELTDGSKPVSTCECYQGMEAEGSLDAKRIKVDFISLTSTPPFFSWPLSVFFFCVLLMQS